MLAQQHHAWCKITLGKPDPPHPNNQHCIEGGTLQGKTHQSKGNISKSEVKQDMSHKTGSGKGQGPLTIGGDLKSDYSDDRLPEDQEGARKGKEIITDTTTDTTA